MEHTKRDTASEVRKRENLLVNHLWMIRTPVKQNEASSKQPMCQGNAQRLPFSVLPSHITPPTKLRKFVKNPFEPDLTNRLHQSVISPTVFTKASNLSQESPDSKPFTWNIDELAHIQPAKIEESPMQQVVSPDSELEVKAQAAIDRFFKQNQIIPSPWNGRQQKDKPCISMDTPSRPLDDLISKELPKSKKDAWSQTVLSLPVDLPQNVEEVLKPFYMFTQEQNTENDDANLSNNSLRRKLFFNHNECADNESVESLSPVKMSESMMLSCSPPQSGMFVHGRLKKMLQGRRHSDESSAEKSEDLSPPNVSPICNTEEAKSHEKVGYCSRLATQIDFTMDISMNSVPMKSPKLIDDYEEFLDTSLNERGNKNDMKCMEKYCKLIIVNNGKTNLSNSVNMEELPRCINSVDNIVHFNAVKCNDKDHNNSASSKTVTEMESSTRESHKQSNIMSGAFTQQSISNTIQDTGYQTYSMNNTMHMVDSYSDTSVSHRTHWSEQIAMSRDNAQLSWRENMSNVFSSTPSKCNIEDES